MFAVHLDSDSPDTSLRRSCSLSDLSMPNAVVQPKRKIEQGKFLPFFLLRLNLASNKFL